MSLSPIIIILSIEIEKNLSEAKKPLEDNVKELKNLGKKREISDKVRKAKIVFNTRGKINKKESL